MTESMKDWKKKKPYRLLILERRLGRMIEINDKVNCSGCTACYAVCPQSAIEMKLDEEGFKYPRVDKNRCVECGLCNSVCPILNKRKIGEETTSGYIVQNKNDSIRLKSTSGAAINAIAEYVISCGGVVFGCEFSDDRVCRHTMATDISDLGKFQGSKYVQSELGDCFKSIKEQLDADKKVLFIGMPCQVAGLESYIKRNKENLYLIDLACHGVPSPGVFKDFIQFLEHKYKGKISNFVFRDKTYGYSATNIKVYFANGKTIDCRNDIKTFTRLMFKGITLRPSCYECAFKTTEVEHELDANAFKNLNNGSPDSFLGYAKLYKKITGKVFKGNHECIEKDSYRILNINTSILAGSAYDEGNLSVYCGPLLEECKKIKNDDKINIAFMHHGVEFLKKTERRKFEQLMESHYIDIVFSGHSHDIGIRTYDHTGNRMRQFTCGGPLKDGYNKPSFYYCIYDSDTHELKCYLYTYNDEIQDWNLANTERAFKDGKCSFILPRFQKKSKYFDTTRDRELDGRKNLQDDYLKQFGIVAALPLKEFIRKRNVMIQNAKGNIILAGQSLENAFDIREDNESIVNSIKHNKNIKNIDIFLTDPIMFDSATEVEVGDTPISRIGTTMHTILYDIYKELEKDQSINIYFIPLVQLDHMVFVDDE